MMGLSSLVPSIFTGVGSPRVDKNGRPLKEFKEQPRELLYSSSGSSSSNNSCKTPVFQDDMLQQVIQHQKLVAQQVYEKERHDTLAMLPDVKKITRNSIRVVKDAVVHSHHHHHDNEQQPTQLKQYSAKPRCPHQQGDILEHTMERRRRISSLIAEGKSFNGVLEHEEESQEEERQEISVELAKVNRE